MSFFCVIFFVSIKSRKGGGYMTKKELDEVLYIMFPNAETEEELDYELDEAFDSDYYWN